MIFIINLKKIKGRDILSRHRRQFYKEEKKIVKVDRKETECMSSSNLSIKHLELFSHQYTYFVINDCVFQTAEVVRFRKFLCGYTVR